MQVPCLDMSQPEGAIAPTLRQACIDTGFFYGTHVLLRICSATAVRVLAFGFAWLCNFNSFLVAC